MIRNFNGNDYKLIGDCKSPATLFSSSAETILSTITINPGDIKSGQTFTIMSQSTITATTTTYVVKLYINSASTITNATQLAIGTTVGSNSDMPYFSRTISAYTNNSGRTSFDLINVNLDQLSDLSGLDFFNTFGNSLSILNLPYNIETITTYIFLTARRSSAGTNSLIHNYLIIDI